MPKISNLSSVSGSTWPASTSVLPINVGSTTMKAYLSQVLAGVYSTAGEINYAKSSEDSTALAPPTSGAILRYDTTANAPAWSVPTTGSFLYASSAGTPSWLAAPSSGGFLFYSTVNSSVGPRWAIGNAGTMYYGPGTTLAIGSSGQYLQSTGGVPAWVTLTDPSTGHITTAGSSGQILQTTGGAAAWRDSTTIPGTLPSTIGTSGQLLQTTGGVASWITPSNLSTIADPTSESILAYDTTASAWTALTIDPNELLRVSTAGALEVIAAPTSGALLVYSTADTSGPQWLQKGTSGQFLQTTGNTIAWSSGSTGAGGGGGGTTASWILTKGSSQNFGSSNTYAAIQWLAELRDADGVHSTATNSTHITIPTSGTYIMGFYVNMRNASSHIQVSIMENNSTEIFIRQQDPSTAAAVPTIDGQTMRHFASSGANIHIRIASVSTFSIDADGAGTYGAQFWGHRLS